MEASPVVAIHPLPYVSTLDDFIELLNECFWVQPPTSSRDIGMLNERGWRK